MEEVDVFVTDPTTLDLEVYDLWLKGFTGLLLFYYQEVLDWSGWSEPRPQGVTLLCAVGNR